MLLPGSLMKTTGWQEWGARDNEYREFYRTWSKEEHLAGRRVYDAFYDWCNISDIQNVSLLDVGGGNGTSRVMYWANPEKINYFNVDPQINLLHAFHLDMYPEMKEYDFPYLVGVGEYLPLKSNIFDLSITTAAIDHYYNPSDVFHEIFRCLKAGARLYIMISKHKDNTVVGMASRVSEYYRKSGFLSLSKQVAKRLFCSLRLNGSVDVNTHMHHFRTLEELLVLLYMFNVVRADESKQGDQLYVECLKD